MSESAMHLEIQAEDLSDEALDEFNWGRACYCWANARSDHRTTGGGA